MSTRQLVEAIGILESCFREKFGTPRQPRLVPDSTARLRVAPKFIPAQSLKGLEEFSHVWLLSYLHLNTNKIFLSTVHPPRLRGKTIGVFASRSPHRPSPIGLSLARLDGVQGDTLFLSGIDLVDGTPILDVKPYIPAYDHAPGARSGWMERLEAQELEVAFSSEAEKEARRLEASGVRNLRSVIAQALRHDPRNPRDKSQLREGKELEFFLLDYDVRFTIRGGQVLVLGIGPAAEFKKARRAPIPWEIGGRAGATPSPSRGRPR